MNTKVVSQLLSLVLIYAGLLFSQLAYSSSQKVTQNNPEDLSASKNKIQQCKLIIKVPDNIGMPKRRVVDAVR
jgi:hypothetical protein